MFRETRYRETLFSRGCVKDNQIAAFSYLSRENVNEKKLREASSSRVIFLGRIIRRNARKRYVRAIPETIPLIHNGSTGIGISFPLADRIDRDIENIQYRCGTYFVTRIFRGVSEIFSPTLRRVFDKFLANRSIEPVYEDRASDRFRSSLMLPRD